jgi:hypothetical protein
MPTNHADFAQPTDVYYYFRSKLGRWPKDAALKELSIDSDCGHQCKAAIDAAHEFWEHVRFACNDDRAEMATLVSMTDRVVTAYAVANLGR